VLDGDKGLEFSLERGAYIKLPAVKDVEASWKGPSFLLAKVPPSSSPHWRRANAGDHAFHLDQRAAGTHFRIVSVPADKSEQAISFSPQRDPDGNLSLHRQPVAIWEHRLVTDETKNELLKEVSADIGWLNDINEAASKVLEKFYDKGVKLIRYVSCSSNISGHTEAGLSIIGNTLQLVSDLTIWKSGWSISMDFATILKDGKTKLWIAAMNISRCHESGSVLTTEPAYIEFTRIYIARQSPLDGTPKLVSTALTYNGLRPPTNTIDDEPPKFVVIENNKNYQDARRYILQSIENSRVSDELGEDEKVALAHTIIHTLGFFPSRAN
jgi:hypothetical protein